MPGHRHPRRSRADPVAHRKRLWVFARLAERTLHPSLFVPYVQALEAVDGPLRELLVELLVRVNNVTGHIELCRFLGHADKGVREACAEAIGRVGVKTTFEILCRLSLDPNFGGRIAALDVMAPKARHHIVPLVAAVVEAGRHFERYHALGILADPRFVPPGTAEAGDLAGTLLADPENAPSRGLKILAIHAEETDSTRRRSFTCGARTSPSPRRRSRRSLTARPNEPSASSRRSFRDGPNPIRVAVIETAEAIGTDSVLAVLVEALTQDQLGIQNHALEAIVRLAQGGKVDPARAILGSFGTRTCGFVVPRSSSSTASAIQG